MKHVVCNGKLSDFCPQSFMGLKKFSKINKPNLCHLLVQMSVDVDANFNCLLFINLANREILREDINRMI